MPNSRWDHLGQPVYAPTDMQNWLRCPQFRQYRKKLEPNEVRWEPNRLLGTAIGDGLSAAYRAWGREPNPLPIALEAAERALEDGFVENTEWDLPALGKLVKKGLQKALEVNVPGGRRIVRVDQKLAISRPDLILEDSTDGLLVIVDSKVTMSMDARWQYKRLQEAECDDQWWHYGWEAEAVLGKRVKTLAAHFTVLTPSVRSFVHAWDCEPFMLAHWLDGAKEIWCDMEEERLGLRPVTFKLSGCVGKFGKCPFWDLDWTFRGDWKRAEDFYHLRGKEEWESE